MFEKVNPSHPDKLADRIAGALVDMAYEAEENPRIAVEVLIGHGRCHIICETSARLKEAKVAAAVKRIAGDVEVDYKEVPQDAHLAENQREEIRCGDNGIFRGLPVTPEERRLAKLAEEIYARHPSDGKYIIDESGPWPYVVICQSNAAKDDLAREIPEAALINPIGDWTGGTDVDTGATNRKLGSDMAGSATGGGLHGKDLSKADVSVNIYAWLKAQATGEPVELRCAIGDDSIDGRPYAEVVGIARAYIEWLGGFERFAEWGLVR